MQQYVILPKKENGIELVKYEILIYVCIRRYMNKDTMEAFPSLDTISRDSSCSKPTVIKNIKIIEEKEYFKTRHVGPFSQTVYTFNNEKSFEPFSYEFLDNPKLTKSEKLQILCTQQYMYKNDGIGKITYSDSELSKLTGLNRRTIAMNNSSLIAKGFMTQVELKSKDRSSGLMNKETIYHLNELGQAIVFALQKHENQINEHEKKIDNNSKDILILKNEIKRLNNIIYSLTGVEVKKELPKRLQEKNLEYFDTLE